MKKLGKHFFMSSSAIFIVCTLIISGCTYTDQVRREYKKIDLTNGVNEFEAVTIAENELITKGQEYYIQLGALLRQDEHAQKYPDYWFVGFSPKTYYKDEFPGYLVVINKKTGEIVHSRDYYFPNQIPSLEWVFEKR